MQAIKRGNFSIKDETGQEVSAGEKKTQIINNFRPGRTFAWGAIPHVPARNVRTHPRRRGATGYKLHNPRERSAQSVIAERPSYAVRRPYLSYPRDPYTSPCSLLRGNIIFAPPRSTSPPRPCERIERTPDRHDEALTFKNNQNRKITTKYSKNQKLKIKNVDK